MANNHTEIDRLLEVINGESPAEFFRRSVRDHASDWIASKLRFGVKHRSSRGISTPILFDTLNEIRAIVVARIECERTEGSTGNDG